MDKFLELLKNKSPKNLIGEQLRGQLKKQGIVVVYNSSDEWLEFDGAIRETVEVWEGRVVFLDQEGDLYNKIKDENKKYYIIENLWEPESNDCLLRVKTNIPEIFRFKLQEQGKPYCKGLIFYKSMLNK